MMNSLHDNVAFSLNMRDESNDVVFNTCIGYNKHSVWTIRKALINIFELVKMDGSCFGIITFHYIKKMIRKSVY